MTTTELTYTGLGRADSSAEKDHVQILGHETENLIDLLGANMYEPDINANEGE